MELFKFHGGDLPLMLSIPHEGTWIPPEIENRLSNEGLTKRDTDWFLQDLYDIPVLKNASRIISNVSRYVVDLNRATSDENLYPGQNTTGLCPVQTFRGIPLYQDGFEPDKNEIAARVQEYWKPYHEQLSRELERLVAEFGFVVLLDGHSIADVIPRLFEGQLPTFNFGTNRGQTCPTSMQSVIDQFNDTINEGGVYSSVVNGRFVGGFITRNYGDRKNVHAVQLELAQRSYMDQDNLVWQDSLARQVQPVIQSFITKLQEWIQTQ